MKAVPEARSKLVKPESLVFHGWLKNWASTYNLEELHEPLTPEERDRILGGLSASLPDEYLDLTSQCEGFLVGDCAVLGLSQVYEVTTSEANYYLLAEVDGEGVVGIRAHSTDRALYFLDYGGTDPVRLQLPFAETIERYINRERKG